MIISRKYFNLGNKCLIERLEIAPPFRLGAFFQNEACFLYLREGHSLLNGPTEKIALSGKESVLLKCGNYFADFVNAGFSGNNVIFAVHLHPGMLREIYQTEIPSFLKSGQKPVFAHKITGSTIIGRFIENLDIYFENPELVNDELLRLKVKELILLLLQTRNAGAIHELISRLFHPGKATVSEVVSTHLFSGLRVEELARLCGLSLSSFKRVFEKIYGDSPARYFKNKQLERAKELLMVSGYSVSEIAYQAGFSDAAYFSRAFHQKYKKPPTEYRKLLKE